MIRLSHVRIQALIRSIYLDLWQEHGPQGWWPVLCEDSESYYHPKAYNIPKTRAGRFEVCVGAILTQNTAWTNVEKALWRLSAAGYLAPEVMLQSSLDSLQEFIRPAGYYHQKSSYLLSMCEWFLRVEAALDAGIIPSRAELLACRGVGPETADSILLYAYFQPTFVVDTYTKRILSGHGLIDETWSYTQIQDLFQSSLAPDVTLFQEYHALIVAHAKVHYTKKKKIC